MHNPELYPVTARLERDTADISHPLKQQLIELVGEYEHGTADAIDLFEGIDKLDDQAALEVYARVVEDVLLALQELS